MTEIATYVRKYLPPIIFNIYILFIKLNSNDKNLYPFWTKISSMKLCKLNSFNANHHLKFTLFIYIPFCSGPKRFKYGTLEAAGISRHLTHTQFNYVSLSLSVYIYRRAIPKSCNLQLMDNLSLILMKSIQFSGLGFQYSIYLGRSFRNFSSIRFVGFHDAICHGFSIRWLLIRESFFIFLVFDFFFKFKYIYMYIYILSQLD